MNMQVQFNPINLFQSRHCKDEEAFLWYSELLEAIWKNTRLHRKEGYYTMNPYQALI